VRESPTDSRPLAVKNDRSRAVEFEGVCEIVPVDRAAIRVVAIEREVAKRVCAVGM